MHRKLGLLGHFHFQRVLLPVIHVESPAQAARNAMLARAAHADGIFLIDHGGGDVDLNEVFAHVRHVDHEEFPDREPIWIGLNFLDSMAENAFSRVTEDTCGLWTDDTGYIEDAQNPVSACRLVWEARKARADWHGVYFGGVAFKYRTSVRDVETAARLVAPFVDVVTTSGEATGSAPSVEKIARMKQALGERPLAIASGVTIDNVAGFLPYVSAFLVATGISQDMYNLDFHKTRDLADIIHLG